MSPLSFLSPTETENLWRVFGPGTAAGRNLRSIFAPTQQQVASKLNYPRLSVKKTTATTPEPVQPIVIQYPRFRRKKIRAQSQPIPRGRKPVQLIRKEMLESTIAKPDLDSKDMSLEKIRLQESFQFAHAKILPPAIAGGIVVAPTSSEVVEYMKGRCRRSGDEDEELVAQIVSNIRELQASNESDKQRVNEKIRREFRDLELVTSLL